MSLKDTAMLVHPRFKVWSGRKLDKEATKKLCQDAGAKEGAARVNKSLMADEPQIKKIRKLMGQARNYHYDHTLPWEDRNGGRILPTGLFIPYQKQMEKFIDQIRKEIAVFCEESYYKQAVAKGKADLGTLGQDDYEWPSLSKIKYMFEAELDFYPIPDQTDFRVQLGAHDLQRLKASAAQTEKNVIKAATEKLWERLHKLAKLADEALSDPDYGFHKTTPKKIKHFSEIVGALNIGEDRFIEEIAKELAEGFKPEEVDDIKKDPNRRAEAAQKAQTAHEKIKRQMEAFANADKA